MDVNKLDLYRGKIISCANELDEALAWKLRRYFFKKTNKQSQIFFKCVLNAPYLTFDKKIQLYEQIPDFRNQKNYQEIIYALRNIQKLRNVVAHWHFFGAGDSDDEVILYDPSDYKKFKINSKVMDQLEANDKVLLKSFGWYFTLSTRYGIETKETTLHSKRNIQISSIARLVPNLKHLGK